MCGYSPTLNGRRSTFAAAFTLIELLVVVGILAVLLTIVGVVASRARTGATKFQLNAQLQTIALALDAYKDDFGSYPITNASTPPNIVPKPVNFWCDREGLKGSRLLCKALMGSAGPMWPTPPFTFPGSYDTARPHQDGQAGLGFRVVGRTGVAGALADDVGNMTGKLYGPYLAEGKFKLANTVTIPTGSEARGDVVPGTLVYDDTVVLLDANDQPILYYPLLNAQAELTTRYAYVGQGTVEGLPLDAGGTPEPPPYRSPVLTEMYRSYDNGAYLPPRVWRILMGDYNDSFTIDGTEKPLVRGKYILWTTGPDGKFGPRNASGAFGADTAAVLATMKNGYDDVTNFQND